MGSEASSLRDGLLSRADVALAGAGEQLEAVAAALSGLGAEVHELGADPIDEDAVTAAAQGLPPVSALVCDAGALMRGTGAAEDGAIAAGGPPAAGEGGPAALRAAVEGTWTLTRAVVNAHLGPTGFGKIVLIAPRPRDGADAAAAGAALENLARTTSVEWARLGIRVVVLRPRDATSHGAVAQLVAFLVSPAGDYASGCVFDLGLAPVGA